MKTTMPSVTWLLLAKERDICWSYHTVDEHPVGRREVDFRQRPDVRVTLVSQGTVSLLGLTRKGKEIVTEVQSGVIGGRLGSCSTSATTQFSTRKS